MTVFFNSGHIRRTQESPAKPGRLFLATRRHCPGFSDLDSPEMSLMFPPIFEGLDNDPPHVGIKPHGNVGRGDLIVRDIRACTIDARRP